MFSKMVLENLLNLLSVDSRAKDLIHALSMVFCLIREIFSATSSRSLSLVATLALLPSISAAFLFFARSILLLSLLRTWRWWQTWQNVCTARSCPPLPCLSVKPAKFFQRWHCVHHLRKTRPCWVSRHSKCLILRLRLLCFLSKLNPLTDLPPVFS